jgi:adhesin/invasin
MWVISGPQLYAFDAVSLQPLYNTNQAPNGRDKLPPVGHFVTQTVANGKVYVATQNSLEAYGLFEFVTVTGGNAQTVTVATALPAPIQIHVANPYTGQPVVGAAVNFSDGCKPGSTSCGSFNPSSAVTDSNGNASTTYTVPQKAGTSTLTMSGTGFGNATATATATAAAAIKLISYTGAKQTAAAGSSLANPVIAQAQDAYKNGVPGVTINFTANHGGIPNPSPVVTDANGLARTTLQLPTSVSTVTVTASSAGFKNVIFLEYSVAGPAANIVVTSGNNQSATAGTQLPQALAVLVTDQYGNPVSGVDVDYDDGGAGGTFSNANPGATSNSGTANQFYTLPPSPGTITIDVTAAGIATPAVFSESSLAGPAANIATTSGNNQTTPAGMQLPQALTVLVTDRHNNPVSGVSVSFNDSGAGGTFYNPNPSVTNSSGIVTQIYSLPPVVGVVTINANASGVTNPAVFVETSVPGPPANVAVTSGNNQSATAATQLPQTLLVLVADHFGNPVPNVSVSFSDAGIGGTFYNPNPGVTGASGTAAQTYLLPSTAGTITISATANGVANPALFNETAGAGNAANIAITSGNNQFTTAGTQLPMNLTVLVTDQYNNPVAGVTVSFDDGGAGGAFSNPNPGVTDNTGSSTQIYTVPQTPGTVTITAVATGVSNPAIFTETGQ